MKTHNPILQRLRSFHMNIIPAISLPNIANFSIKSDNKNEPCFLSREKEKVKAYETDEQRSPQNNRTVIPKAILILYKSIKIILPKDTEVENCA